MSAKQTTTATTTVSPCGCPEVTPAQPCCCNLVCFERPDYFCGHLLTDADLTLQQRYVIEKNKLYHRTLDGYGVVCGLKLTCDCDCKGHILIHDGFAIDDCGNDLVVCETTRFDVIGMLRSKNLLWSDPPEDECEPRRHRSHCHIKQCFYITICYDETVSDFETPFQSSCTSGPKQCMPTRTHECVRFDVTDKLPPTHSCLDDLEERIKHCFEVHCDGPVGRILREHAPRLLHVLGEGDLEEGERFDPCELFCLLRAYFLNHLKVNPDQFNCGLYEEVVCLTCPRECCEEIDRDRRGERFESRRREEREEKEYLRYREELREAFRKLLYCIQRYQYDCVLGDLVFYCQQPCEAHCLVLGTIEVVDGKLVRVCNTPRRYLWAPANLQQVLIHSILTGEHHCYDEDCEDERAHCCPDYHKFEPVSFLRECMVSECGRYNAATSALDAFKAVARSLHHCFEFSDSMAISPKTLAEVPPDQLKKIKEWFGISASVANRKASDLSFPTPMQALQSHALLRRGDSIVAYPSEGATNRVLPDFVNDLSPDRTVGMEIEKALRHAKEQAEEATLELRRLREEFDAFKLKMESASEESKKPPKKS
jgi:hypothetical protein